MTPPLTHAAFNQYGLGALALDVPGGDIGVTDNSIPSGLYRITTATVGAPVDWGSLVHIRRSTGGGETQLVIADAVENLMLFRRRTAGAWGPWRGVITADSTTVPAGVQTALNTKSDKLVGIVNRTSAFTIGAGEVDSLVVVSTNLGDVTCTIPSSDSDPLPVGTTVSVFKAHSQNTLTLQGQPGVTFQSPGLPNVAALYLREQSSTVALIKRTSAIWVVVGAVIEES